MSTPATEKSSIAVRRSGGSRRTSRMEFASSVCATSTAWKSSSDRTSSTSEGLSSANAGRRCSLADPFTPAVCRLLVGHGRRQKAELRPRSQEGNLRGSASETCGLRRQGLGAGRSENFRLDRSAVDFAKILQPAQGLNRSGRTAERRGRDAIPRDAALLQDRLDIIL